MADRLSYKIPLVQYVTAILKVSPVFLVYKSTLCRGLGAGLAQLLLRCRYVGL